MSKDRNGREDKRSDVMSQNANEEMGKTVCGCAACEGWGALHDAWARACHDAPTAAEEPIEPVVVCQVTGERIPSWGPPLRARERDVERECAACGKACVLNDQERAWLAAGVLLDQDGDYHCAECWETTWGSRSTPSGRKD